MEKPKMYSYEVERENLEKELSDNSVKMNDLFKRAMEYYDKNYPNSTQDEVYGRPKFGKFDLGNELIPRELDLLTEEQLVEILYVYDYNRLEKQLTSVDDVKVWNWFKPELFERLPKETRIILDQLIANEKLEREVKKAQRGELANLEANRAKFKVEREAKILKDKELKEVELKQKAEKANVIQKEVEIAKTAKFACPKCGRGFNNQSSFTNHAKFCKGKEV